MNTKIPVFILLFLSGMLIFSCGNKNSSTTAEQDNISEQGTEALDTTENNTDNISDQPLYNLSERTDHPPMDSKDAFIKYPVAHWQENQ